MLLKCLPACGAFCAASTWWASKCWVALPDIVAALSGECESSVRVCFLLETELARAQQRGDGERRAEKRQRSPPRSRPRPRARALWLTLSEGCLTLAPLSQWLTLCAATCMCVLLIDWWEPWAHRLDVRLLLFLSSATFQHFFFPPSRVFTYLALHCWHLLSSIASECLNEASQIVFLYIMDVWENSEGVTSLLSQWMHWKNNYYYIKMSLKLCH